MPRALLVEPDAVLRGAIKEVLDNGGLSVIALACGWNLFHLFDRIEPPRLLVSDINLGPTLDGFKLATAAQCRWAGLPVMCIAGRPVRYTTLTYEPCDWFRMTPFTPEGFLDAVHSICRNGTPSGRGPRRQTCRARQRSVS